MFLAGAQALTACSPPASPPPRNLLIITVDTLRADRLGAYGYAQARTPAMDALASQGALFENAATCIPRTTQAVASLFTSRYPHEHGVLEIGERLPEAADTLAERLASAGFATVGISANGAASRRQGLDQGFETFVDRRDFARRRAAAGGPGEVASASAVTDRAIAWLRAREPGRYFLWILYLDPHFRYEPPARFNGGLDPRRTPFYAAIEGFEPRKPTIYFDLNGKSAAAQAQLSRLYDAEVAYVDAEVGRLLAELDRLGERANTLVVLTADHGESLGEHGYYYQHGDFVYEPSTRIPLILQHAGTVPAGARIEAPASILDIAPTVLALLGARGDPAASRGSDLTPLLTGGAAGPEPAQRIVFAESGSSLWPHNPRRALGGRRSARLLYRKLAFRYAREGGFVIEVREDEGSPALYDARRDPALAHDVSEQHPQLARDLAERLARKTPLDGRWRMARDARFKLVRMPELEGARYALYDLALDPGEERDATAEHPEVALRLRAALEGFLRSLPEERDLPAPPRTPSEELQVEEALRGLGYVE